jgi:enediyne biosynthesis protein E4
MKISFLKVPVIAGFVFMASLSVSGQIRFEDVTEKAGLIEPLKGMMGHCATWGDVNGDGYPDLFVGTFTHKPDSTYNVRGHKGGPEPDKLFINRGDGTFQEVLNSPVRIKGKCSGAAFADFDNDGDLDLVISHQSHETEENPNTKHSNERISGHPNNYLFENDGKGNLTDVTKAAGLDFGWPFLGRNTFVFDYDGDGLLDIFMQEDWVLGDISAGDSRLMKNMGNLKFKDVTEEAGFPHGFRQGLYGLGGFVGDINGDSWPDVYFAHSCRMFINNKNGTFHEKHYDIIDNKYTRPATVNSHWTCSGDIGDFDNDGDMDMMMGDHFGWDTTFHRMYVFLNEGNDANGDPILRDITKEAGVANPDGHTFHSQIQDIDNDGRMDIITSRCNAIVYRNSGVVNGIPHFESPVNTGIKGGIGYWAGGALCDYDRDGRLDLMGPEWEQAFPSVLLRNVTPGAQNYINIKPELQNSANRNGIGAKVEIYKAGMLGKKKGLLGTSIISISNGYSCGYESIAHFGLPNDKKVDIRLTMPCNGKVYTATSVARNQLFVLKK